MTTDARRTRFEMLWDEHRHQVLAYCLRRLPPAEAEDVCAETFLVAWRRIEDVPPPPGALLYLYGIAGRVLSNHFRAFHRRSRLEERLLNLGVEPATDPVVLVVQGAEHAEVATAVRNLKPKDREIVMLYAWEGVAREDIASMLGMSKPAVDQRIHRAYQRLARMLQPVLQMRVAEAPPGQGTGGK